MIALINPPLATQAEDPLGSGIPYLPVTLAYLAAVLRGEYRLRVIDAFGNNPFRSIREGRFVLQGMTAEELTAEIPADTQAAVVFISSVMAYTAVCGILRRLKAERPDMPVVAIENSQAVIGCSLEYLGEELLAAGADYVVLGECETRVPRLLRALEQGQPADTAAWDGIIYKTSDGTLARRPKVGYLQNLDSLPFPAWELFPLENYWKLGYAHGPMEGRYLAMLTSRGCPCQCNFCVVPATNEGKWRARTPENVVAEFEHGVRTFGVREFHWEDLNPTASETRILEVCRLIREKGLRIRWKLASGSKIETLSLDALDAMRRAGCAYISFSPESGSPEVLKRMNKRFDHAHALRMTARMHRLGIASQACFVLGYPGETPAERKETADYIRKLTRAGVDEIAVFMLTPIPGTETFGELSGYGSYSELTFAPTWRSDYAELRRCRDGLYRSFFLWKLRDHPLKLVRQGLNLLRRKFESKAEMNIYRILKMKFKR